MALPQKKFWTPEEYLAFEREADTKHEYLDGQIYDMAGASEEHLIITGNTAASLHGQLRKRDCVVLANDMRVKVNKADLYTYPDLVIICGKRNFDDLAYLDTLLNPTVIIEVLSPSTEKYDRGEKFRRYRTLESLQDYVLISQDKPLIERFSRQVDGGWLLTDAQGLEAEMSLPSVECVLSLADVYEKVNFEEVDSAKE